MNKNFFYLIALCAVILPFFTSCNEDDGSPEEPVIFSEYVYVLNSGNMDSNNASLSLYNLKDSTVIRDVFEAQNGRRLGDSGQDMIVYGSKIYIAMYGESTIEVLDLEATSIEQIETEGQPRALIAHEGKVYISYFNGYVARMDTTSLTVEAKVQVGRNPERIAIANGKLYVANSGGLDYSTEIGYDKTVSVVDLASFTETKKIEVIINPCNVASYNNSVYVVSMGNYGDIPNTLQLIDASTDQVSIVEDFNGTYLTAVDNTLYTIFSQYDAEWNQVINYYSYDMVANKILSDHFIGNAEITQPYNISGDETTGNVFIMTSDYTNNGDVYMFDKDNKPINTFEVGLNPMKAVYVKK